MKNIGARIRNFREQRNMTQVQLSEAVNTDRSNISKIETGESPGSMPLFFRIAAALGVTVGELLDEAADEQAATSELPKTG